MKKTGMSSSFIGKVLDNYRIIENLGIGGMGFVFKAIHIKLDKIFALKMIAPSLAMNKDFIKRFETEARALAKLEDPNIVRIYDLRSDNDQWFIIMEYIDGMNLMEMIRNDGAMKWQKALPIFKQVLTGIGHAHAAGIIHRDIKPNNIMVTGGGVVKITDFGLAKDQSGRATTMSITSGGTLYYMSPEHVKGISFTDKRSDIYSIGMTFYETISGNVPFKSLDSDFDIRETIMRKELIKPSAFNAQIPTLLEDIIMKSLAKSPDQRFQNTGTMLEALEDFEQKIPVLELGQELLADSSYKLKKKPVSLDMEGPDTRFEKVLKQQSRDLIRRYGMITLVFLFLIISVVTYLILSKPASAPRTPKESIFKIETNPSGADVYVDRLLAGTTPLHDYSIGTGDHHIRFEKNGYQTIDTLIWSPVDKKIVFSLDLRPVQRQKGTPILSPKTAATNTPLLINSDPPGAQIWINDIHKGATPLKVSGGQEKTWKIRIEKKGYHPYIKSFSPQNTQITQIDAKLSIISGSLQIMTIPGGASLTLDGKPLINQTTPVLLSDLATGTYQLQILKNGFHSQIREVLINPEDTTKLSVDLVPLQGKLALQVRPWGSVYLNNELQKATSDVRYEFSLPVNQYELKVVHPTLGRWVKKIVIETDQELNVVVDFSRTFEINITTVDESGRILPASIIIDDKNSGSNTPASVQLHTGIHRLSVRKDGYIAINGEQEIFIDPNAEKIYKIVLKKIE